MRVILAFPELFRMARTLQGLKKRGREDFSSNHGLQTVSLKIQEKWDFTEIILEWLKSLFLSLSWYDYL